MQTILHIVDSLQIGGTETNLVKTIRSLKEYNHVVITLRSSNEFGSITENCPVISIQHKNLLTLLRSIWRLNKAIKLYKPKIVRSYLFWSSVIARLACPKSVKCIFSVHSLLSKDVFRNKAYVWLEKFCYKKYHTVIFVSNSVKDDYSKIVALKGKYYVLYNFIEMKYFSESAKHNFDKDGILKMVVIGNFREVKNHMYLLNALKNNTHLPVRLDIYGDGRLLEEYKITINENRLPVLLKGKCFITKELLREYDLFVMPSLGEGCPTALQEAMAAGLPLLVSDINVMHEVTGNNAVFLNLSDNSDFIVKINLILKGQILLDNLAQRSLEYAKENYTQLKYIERLNKILHES